MKELLRNHQKIEGWICRHVEDYFHVHQPYTPFIFLNITKYPVSVRNLHAFILIIKRISSKPD